MVPSDYSAHANARLTIFPASADPFAMAPLCDEFGRARDGRRSWSRTPSTTSSSGIQRPSPATELHPVMEPHHNFEKEQYERRSSKTPESELHTKIGQEIGASNEIAQVRRNHAPQTGLTCITDTLRQQRNFGKSQLLASISSRPEEVTENDRASTGEAMPTSPIPPPIPPRSPQLKSLPLSEHLVSSAQKDQPAVTPSDKTTDSTSSSSTKRIESSTENRHSDNETTKMVPYFECF